MDQVTNKGEHFHYFLFRYKIMGLFVVLADGVSLAPGLRLTSVPLMCT
jgi:hypothetical protein